VASDPSKLGVNEWREKAREERGAGGTRTLEGPGEGRRMQKPHLQVGTLRRRRSENTLNLGERDKRKIVGTLKREILRLAKLAQDDYPCRMVNLAAHLCRNFIREAII
jgi:hypothetical protein